MIYLNNTKNQEFFLKSQLSGVDSENSPKIKTHSDQISLVLIVMAISAIMYFSLIENPFSFNYELDIHNQYRLNFIILLVSIPLCIKARSLFFSLSIRKSLLLLFACLLMTIILFSENYSFSNEHFFSISVIILFFSFIYLLDIDSVIIIIFLFLFFFYLFELGIGTIELFDFVCGQRKSAPSGTVRNSGIFSIILVTGLPMVYYGLFCTKEYINIRYNHRCLSLNLTKDRIYSSVLKNVMLFLIIILTASILSITQSRTAIVTFLIIIPCLFLNHKSKLIVCISRKKVILIAGVLLLFFLYSMTRFKTNSLSGRMLIGRITMEHFWDNFLLGVGPGRFPLYYPGWQSEYLKNLQADQHNQLALLAGETYLAFNEYLQFFKECGLLGMVIGFYLSYIFFKSKATANPKLVNVCKLTILAILISSASSYPLHVNYVLFVSGFCVFTVWKSKRHNTHTHFPYPPSIKLTSLIPFFFVLMWFTFSGIRTSVYAELWRRIDFDERYPIPIKIERYKQMYNTLSNDGKYLAKYGQTIANIDGISLEFSSSILEKAKSKTMSVSTIQNLSQIYSKKKQNLAEANLVWLVNFVPNKFAFKYDLLSFYILTKQSNKARNIASVIISMPAKINSKEVTQIRNEAQVYLRNSL